MDKRESITHREAFKQLAESARSAWTALCAKPAEDIAPSGVEACFMAMRDANIKPKALTPGKEFPLFPSDVVSSLDSSENQASSDAAQEVGRTPGELPPCLDASPATHEALSASQGTECPRSPLL
jgi:hypothetical protein